MGFISSSLNTKAVPRTTEDRQRGRRIWEEAFGRAEANTSTKERPVRGNSFGRSMTGTAPAQKRLLQALRSMAPGGWSDDRWEQSARHFVSAAYVAIHRQNELLTQSEFQVFRKDDDHPDGKVPITKNDPPEGGRMVKPYALVELLEKPNPEDSFGDLIAAWNLNMDLTGSALTWMVPNNLPNGHPDRKYEGAGTPFELYPIPTPLAIPQPAVNPDFPDGFYRIQPVYPYGPFSSYPTPASAVGAPIPAQWMMRMKYPHPLLRYEGYSPLTALRLQEDGIESIDRSRWYKMKRDMSPSAVLQADEMEGAQPWSDAEIERMKAEMENEHQGPENLGRLLVCPPGMHLDEWGRSAKEMDYSQGWEQLMSFMLAGLGVTKPSVGMVDSAAYANLFASLKQLYWITLDPKCSRYGSKLTRFLAPFFGDSLIVEVRCKRIDDHEIAFNKINTGISGRFLKKNEARKLLDLPVTDEEWGNDIVGDPSPNEVQMQQAAAAPPGAPAPPGMDLGMAPAGAEQPAEEMGILDALMGGESDPRERPRDEVEEVRPLTGTLDAGSLGPRMKYLNGKKKSLYESIRSAIKNGNGKNGHHK